MSEKFYDYHCNSCGETYTSNEVETECYFCGKKALVIEVQRPKVVRRRKVKLSEVEPDFEWERELLNRR